MTRKKILVVDDAEFNRDLLVQLLEDQYELVVAIDGEQGVKKVSEERPDLVLMDMGLPILDGWEATRRIKAEREFKDIPVIAITSHAMVGDERKARDAGCDEYLSKPIDEDELMKKIKKHLE